MLVHAVAYMFLVLPIISVNASSTLQTEVSTPQPQPQPQPQKLRLKVGFDRHPPFNFFDDNGDAVGIDIEQLKLILDEAGLEYDFYERPWKRVLREIENGALDISMGAAKTEDRKGYAYFSEVPLTFGRNSLIVKQENLDLFSNVDSISDLIGMPFKVSARRGVSYSAEYETLLSDPKFFEQLIFVNSVEQSIDITLAKRAVGLISNSEIFKYEYAKKCNEQVFVEVFDLLEDENGAGYIMLSKQTVSPQTLTLINQAMQKIKSTPAQIAQAIDKLFPKCHFPDRFIKLETTTQGY